MRGTSWISRFVRLYQWLRRGPASRPAFADGWSHAALVTGSRGRIVEVVYWRPRASHVGKYRDVGYHHVRVAATRLQRLAALRFAEARVARPSPRPFDHCSSLVAQALAAGGAAFPRAPGRMLPGDLGWHYGVRSSPAGDNGAAARGGTVSPSAARDLVASTLPADTTPR